MARIVTIELDTDTAEFSVDLSGFHGKGCADILKMFENLGAVKTHETKPEYKQTQVGIQTVRK